MANEETADTEQTEEQEDLISQFFSDSDASAEDKQSILTRFISPGLRRLVLLLADWCYDEGYDDGEAGRQ